MLKSRWDSKIIYRKNVKNKNINVICQYNCVIKYNTMG